MIVTTTWERRTFRVRAVRVTAENIAELAEWCGGEIKDAGLPATNAAYIKVPTRGSAASRAHIGDWITKLGYTDNYRVYQNKSFLQAFREIFNEEQKYAEIHQVIVNAMRKQDVATYNGESSKGMDLVADKATRDILGLF